MLLEHEKKLIGMNGNFVLTIASPAGGAGAFCNLSLSFNIPATSVDLSGIDASSMEIRFPILGWIKPEIRETEYSIDVSLNQSDMDPRRFKYLRDIAYFFDRDAFELELKYRNKKTSGMESKLAIISYITISISEEGNKIYDVQAKSFDKLDSGQKSSLKKYLEKFSK